MALKLKVPSPNVLIGEMDFFCTKKIKIVKPLSKFIYVCQELIQKNNLGIGNNTKEK